MSSAAGLTEGSQTMIAWRHFDESLDAGYSLGLEIERTIVEMQTGRQTLGVYLSSRFGRVLALDGVIQTTEFDEVIYHEMLSHAPILAHGAAKRVCIIGGGDGGMLREVIRHQGVRATMVEIDPAVVALSREHLPMLSAGAFDHPRATLIHADGARYLAETGERFDVIIVDSTDPVGPAEVLFSQGFYASCKRALNPGGVLVTQNGVPMVQRDELLASMRSLQGLFADARCYLATVPTYWGGPMAFGWASDDPALGRRTPEFLTAAFAAARLTTRYYSPAVHIAAFALPRYVEEIIGEARRGA